MNQDFPLSNHPQPAGDFWTQNAAAASSQPGIVPYAPTAPGRTGGSQTSRPSSMQKIHRLLRGRYPLAIVLAAAGALLGGGAGYFALPPKYESAGFVQVNPTYVGQNTQENLIPMLSMFIQTQVGLISGSDVADKAMKDPAFIDAWDKAYPNAPYPATADFIAALDPEHVKNGALIRVAFTDKNKGVAEAGCKAAIKAYMELHGDDHFSKVEEIINYNNNKLATAHSALVYEEQTLDHLREQYGTVNLEDRSNKMQADLVDYERQTEAAKNAYEEASASLQSGNVHPEPVNREEVYNQIAAVPDIPMQRLLLKWNDARAQLEKLSARIGSRNPVYQAQQLEVQIDEKSVDDYARLYLSSRGNRLPGAPLQDTITPEYVAHLKQRYDDLKKYLDGLKGEAKDLGFQMDQIAKVRDQIRVLNDQISTCTANINGLDAQRTLNKIVIPTDPGGEAQIPTDKRKLAAGVGFTFGGLIPIGLMLLYGLTENRYRFSDDADEHSMLGITLLGILPNLPDRLSDPQQAGVAAHCVHQIRTMLQISRSNDEPQVLAITSASSGDGKTSLCLALGLSYAACGARTLLIDCDLVAAGLTHRLNVVSTDGVLEAVANRALLEYVRTTDIADVAILPVGTTHAHHASTLSPVALRRLISEGKKHFDIIIIDTGPLLGSIEASLVCAAADRSILAVARNQQRPLVERSIRHLQEIGAHLAGVVFNRAHASDFERSMSGLALRSRPAGPQVPGSDVAGSFKKKAG
jgi:succinoglycan biosynthesis transport protein ExoP